MDWLEITVTTTREAVEAVADLFTRLGSGGVIIEDPQELQRIANSGEWDAFELPAESLNMALPQVKGYLPCNDDLLRKMEDLSNELTAIMVRIGQEPGKVTTKQVKEEDWANSWKVYFKPLKIGRRLVIRPTWEEYHANEDELVIDLDPGMAFGTGSHATTSMCCGFLEKYLQPGQRVLDVGTGSGILAMSAALLGASEVLALDYDPVAVKVAAENVQLNKLESKITVRRNDLLHGITEQGDFIVANIIADIIIRLLPQINHRLLPGGFLVTSGVINDRKEDVTQAAEDFGFELVEEQNQEGWVAQVWKLK